jgi:RNase adaptor protein for sRNA GlmZ degradation
LNNLRELLKDGFDEYPYLCRILNEMTGLKQFADTRKRELEVRVYSFAYKKGIPDDMTGNGGGYVFDCRAINNPGKYERYNNVTGLDEPVIKFLEEDGEMVTFLNNINPLIDQHVKRYMERNFTNLMISFGCTGGQHRSVYAAQHVAEHISSKFGVKVSLVHREQNLEQEFRKRN